MKILGSETRRNGNSTFSLTIVDCLDSIYSILVKNSFWNNADSYKKYTYTNGRTERIDLAKENQHYKLRFKVVDGDWLVIVNDNKSITMYISEQYCGPIKTKNKKVQEIVDSCYTICRERIESKRNFAKEMGAVSRKLNMPFQIVLALKGDEELLKQMVKNIENAIEKKMYDDKQLMHMLASNDNTKREEAIYFVGQLQIPNYQVEKVANYILDCLENKKIVRRY